MKYPSFTPTHSEYPAMLKAIPDAPGLLYVHGSLPAPSEKLIAVVGTRKPTAYGIEAAKYFTRELVRAGFSIVSGMALGVDGVAHTVALAEGARTYAVLGCGIDIAYPAEHNKLYQRIAVQGAVLSEYAPGTPPLPFRFPARNRIIAGMTLGTLVVEAKIKSGALITGRLALDYNREVFAVPGQIFSQVSRGPHQLIQSGAKMVQELNDILGEFGFEAMGARERLAQDLAPAEQKVLALLENAAQHVDALAVGAKLNVASLHAALTMLELKGLVEHLGGKIYSLKR